MSAYLRLRQICLVAADLERAAADIQSVLGVNLCYRDPNVAKYGLVNALFPIGTDFLEVVSPTRAGTTAGRFLESTGGKGGLGCSSGRAFSSLASGLRPKTMATRPAGVNLTTMFDPLSATQTWPPASTRTAWA